MKYNKNASQFYITLIDSERNPVSGVNITMNINGVFYIRYTDSNGIARLNIRLMAGEYIITSAYDGMAIANMWSIMGYIIDFTDGITGKISATSGYTLSVSGDMESIIDSCLELPSFELSGEWLEKFWSTIGCSLLFLIGGIVLLFIMVASCLSIISSAFQRILKPLMILPFAGIAIALGAGGHDISRSLLTYIKTFFGFCISGALMVVAVKTGVSLCTNLVNFNLAGASNVYKCILITVQMAITPIVISGLVKGSDAITSRMF